MSQDDTSQSFVDFKQQITAVPNYGLKLKFNHKFPEKENFSQNLKPSWKQIWDIIPMIFRYVPYYWRNSRAGQPVLMDYFSMQNSQGIYGSPLGGIGAGKCDLENVEADSTEPTPNFVARINWTRLQWRVLPVSTQARHLRVQHNQRESIHSQH